MNPPRPDALALALAGLVVVVVAVLAALHVPIPEVLPSLGFIFAGVGGGAALNTRPAVAEPAQLVEQAAAEVLPALVPAPADAPAVESIPAPVATHAP